MATARGTLALLGITLSLVTLLTASFLIAESLGYTEEPLFREWLLAIADRDAGRAAAAGAITALLAADLVLPVPSSVLMMLAGYVCGAALGAAASFVGAMLSAWIGFFACRRFGRGAFRRLVGDRDLAAIERFVDRYGAWAILLSRPVPMLTEVTSCIAGLSGMPPRRFSGLAAAGTLPICAVYAWAGAEASGDASLVWPIVIALAIPAAGFAVIWWREGRRREPPSSA